MSKRVENRPITSLWELVRVVQDCSDTDAEVVAVLRALLAPRARGARRRAAA